MAGYLYDGQLRIAAQLDGAGAVVSRFYYTESPNSPSFMLRDGQTYRIFSDHLGSPRLVVNVATGEVVLRRSYDPFGRILLDSNPGWLPHGFAGGLYDPDTGLVRFGARDYDPNTGRWTTKDPIRFDGGVNLYAYAENDPCNNVDVTGLATIVNNSSSTIWILYTTADGGMQAWPLKKGETSAKYTGDADAIIWETKVEKLRDYAGFWADIEITDAKVATQESGLSVGSSFVTLAEFGPTILNACGNMVLSLGPGSLHDIRFSADQCSLSMCRAKPKEPGTDVWVDSRPKVLVD